VLPPRSPRAPREKAGHGFHREDGHGFIEKRGGRYRRALATRSATRDVRRPRERRTPSVSCAKCKSASTGGRWIDRRNAEAPLESWAKELLTLARHLPADEVENWLNDEVASGLVASPVHRQYLALRRVLQVAVEEQGIESNPCDRVTPPRIPKPEMVLPIPCRLALPGFRATACADGGPSSFLTLSGSTDPSC